MGLPGKVRVVQPTMAANLVDAYFSSEVVLKAWRIP